MSSQLNKGFWIAIDGPDGTGKTTACLIAEKYLAKRFGKENVIYATTLGSGMIGKAIRKRFLDNTLEKLSRDSQTVSLVTAYVETFNDVIKPALEEGKIIISDRWLYSLYVYQVKLEESKLGNYILRSKDFLSDVFQNRFPDLNIFTETSLEEAERRINSRSKNNDRLDKESLLYKKKIHKAFSTISSVFSLMGENNEYKNLPISFNCEVSLEKLKENLEELISKHLVFKTQELCKDFSNDIKRKNV